MNRTTRPGTASVSATKPPSPKPTAPPPTAFGPRNGSVQAKAGARHPPPPTRYQSPGVTAQAKLTTPPSARRQVVPAPPSNSPPIRPTTVQRMEATPFERGTNSVVATWDQYNNSQLKDVRALRLRTISGIVLNTGEVVVGTSAWDTRGEHSTSVPVFAPVLEKGRHDDFGVSCGEKDALLSVLETAFQGNYRPLKGEHERCEEAYFRIVREKLKDAYGKVEGVVAIDGKDVRNKLSYLDCCDGCYKMLVGRKTRIYGMPDLVHNNNKHGQRLF